MNIDKEPETLYHDTVAVPHCISLFTHEGWKARMLQARGNPVDIDVDELELVIDVKVTCKSSFGDLGPIAILASSKYYQILQIGQRQLWFFYYEKPIDWCVKKANLLWIVNYSNIILGPRQKGINGHQDFKISNAQEGDKLTWQQFKRNYIK